MAYWKEAHNVARARVQFWWWKLLVPGIVTLANGIRSKQSWPRQIRPSLEILLAGVLICYVFEYLWRLLVTAPSKIFQSNKKQIGELLVKRDELTNQCAALAGTSPRQVTTRMNELTEKTSGLNQLEREVLRYLLNNGGLQKREFRTVAVINLDAVATCIAKGTANHLIRERKNQSGETEYFVNPEWISLLRAHFSGEPVG